MSEAVFQPGIGLINLLVYTLIFGMTLIRRGARNETGRLLIIFVLVSMVWEGLGSLSFWERVIVLPPYWLPYLGVFALAFVFLFLSASFLRISLKRPLVLTLGVLWGAAILAVLTGLIAVPPYVVLSESLFIDRGRFLFSLVYASWVVIVAATAIMVLVAHYGAIQPLHKNRIGIWGISLILSVAGDSLVFAGFEPWGRGVRMVAALVAGYVVLIHNLIDVPWAVSRLLGYLITSLLALVSYTALFSLMRSVYGEAFYTHEILAGLVLAIIIVFLINPVLNLVNRSVDRLIYGINYDAARSVRGYSLTISNILDLDRLAEISIELVGKTLDVELGRLFVVDAAHGEAGIVLKPIGEEDIQEAEGRLSEESPIYTHFFHTKQPLTQYDLDFSQRYQNAPESERKWFADLELDVYVPICSKENWIGLFAFGPKRSGDRYFDADLSLLSTLADQTAVALENARLISDLRRLNAQLMQTQKALEEANLKLYEMDEMKTAFISVVTHELRTPLANVAFSLQILEIYGRERLLPEQREQLDQLVIGVKAARTMVDNLVTFAAFVNEQVELKLEQVDFKQTIQESMALLKDMALEKEVDIQTNILGDLLPLTGDRKLLGEAVYHLLQNAIKYTKPRGTVWLSCWTTAQMLCLDIMDTGVGVSPDKLPTLWEGFTQVADPVKRGAEGLGLGLSLVKFIVSAHGGDVWAESQEKIGSVFGFQIPFSGPGGQEQSTRLTKIC